MSTHEDTNIAQLIDGHVRDGRGDRVALRTPAGDYSYAAVAEMANRAGNAFRALGVGPDDRVLVLLPDGMPFVASFFGAVKIGAVAVPLNTRLSPAEYAAIVRDSRAALIVVDAALRPLLSDVAASPRQLVAGPELDAALAQASPDLDEVPRSSQDMAFWLYTSGTTGFPKAAVHLHRTLIGGAPYGEVIGISERDRVFATSKLFFAYALGNVLLLPLMVGAESYLHPAWADPDSAAAVVASYQPTLFFSVPTFYARLLRADLPADTFRSARLCISAGERLPAEICTAFHTRFGVPILDGIGATETIFMFLSNTPTRIRPGSSGVPVPGTEVRIVTTEGHDAGVDEQGVLWVKTGSAAASYWERPSVTAENFRDDWYRTRDLFYRDAEGSYFHAGREDDSFKVAGMWVTPSSLEQAFMEHAGVVEVGVVGVEDERGLVKPFVFVVPRDRGADPTAFASELEAAVGPKLPSHQRPRSVLVVQELPRTATGKLQRYKLKAEVEALVRDGRV